ncbi:hypothetical protein LJN214_006585 [Mesorhizobium sp. LjNodule214]
MTDTAAIAGETELRAANQIWAGRVNWSGRVTKRATTTSSKQDAKAKIAAPTIVVLIMGSSTRNMTPSHPEPRLTAA